MKEVLKHCENRPEIVVDRGFCIYGALQRLRLKYRHETFDERMLLKGSFSDLKREQRGSGIDFHSEVLLTLFRAGIVLWPSITTGGVYLDSFDRTP